MTSRIVGKRLPTRLTAVSTWPLGEHLPLALYSCIFVLFDCLNKGNQARLMALRQGAFVAAIFNISFLNAIQLLKGNIERVTTGWAQ